MLLNVFNKIYHKLYNTKLPKDLFKEYKDDGFGKFSLLYKDFKSQNIDKTIENSNDVTMMEKSDTTSQRENMSVAIFYVDRTYLCQKMNYIFQSKKTLHGGGHFDLVLFYKALSITVVIITVNDTVL